MAAIACIVSRSVDWVAIVLAAFVSILGWVTLRKAASAWGYWLGSLGTCVALAVVAQGLAPLGAFMVMWPVLGAAIVAVLILLMAPKEAGFISRSADQRADRHRAPCSAGVLGGYDLRRRRVDAAADPRAVRHVCRARLVSFDSRVDARPRVSRLAFVRSLSSWE